ncbi:MAG TPA: hypothetical protein DGT23_29890 [Micromonosporaceae bacterium]|nr:hypothetical protein [Micromonosporaceae bacterium]
MDKPSTLSRTRRLNAHYLGISRTNPAVPELGGPLWNLRWLACHGGAGVSTLIGLTGVGHDAGASWPAADPAGPVPVVLVCRASATGTARAAAAIEQSRAVAGLKHIDLLGLVVVAAAPGAVSPHVSARLLLMAGWVRHHWWIGWQDAYVTADDPRTVGPSPDLTGLRDKLIPLLRRSAS